MLTLVNYGLGNIQAFANIYRRLNRPFRIAATAGELAGASRLVLPGVGSFDWAMERLEASAMRPELDRLVLEDKVPVLGICVGLQMMARSSEEGVNNGLGWLPAVVKRFDEARIQQRTRLPHLGWNDARAVARAGLFAHMDSPSFYFLHSYFIRSDDPSIVAATTEYGGEFASAVSHGHIHGVQFHPEKSHACGVQLLDNFASL